MQLSTVNTLMAPIHLPDGTVLSTEAQIIAYIQNSGLWEKLIEVMEGRAEVVAIPTAVMIATAVPEVPLEPHFTFIPSSQTMSMILQELESEGCQFGRGVISLLKGLTLSDIASGLAYECNILLGSEFSDSELALEGVEQRAAQYGYAEPPIGLVPFLRQYLTDDMLRRIGVDTLIVMHAPVPGEFGSGCRLALQRAVDGPWLILDGDDYPGIGLTRRDGFLYLHNASILAAE